MLFSGVVYYSKHMTNDKKGYFLVTFLKKKFKKKVSVFRLCLYQLLTKMSASLFAIIINKLVVDCVTGLEVCREFWVFLSNLLYLTKR